MPRRGDVIETTSGERIEFVTTAFESGGALLETRVRLKPQSSKPPDHFHPHQTEHFEVLSGEFEVVLAGEPHTFGPGDSFVVPAGTVHRMHNAGNEFGEVRWRTEPALKSGEMFVGLWRAQEAGRGRLWTLTSQLRILADHREEFVLLSPPQWVQGILFALVRMLPTTQVNQTSFEA